MEFVIGLLVLGICGSAGFLVSLLVTALVTGRKPRFRRAAGVACIVVGAAGMTAFAWSAGVLFALLAGFACGAGAALAAFRVSKPPVAGIDYVPDEPELVREHGLANFETLDADGDGVIKASDLRPGTLAGLDPEAESAVLAHMRRHIDKIGHWIGSRASEHEVTAEDGKLSPGRRVLTVHSGVFGISREDLRSYPSRARKLLAKRAKPADKPVNAA